MQYKHSMILNVHIYTIYVYTYTHVQDNIIHILYIWTSIYNTHIYYRQGKFKDRYLTGWASFIAQSLKNPPKMQKTWVPSLGREDPLEKEMATHSSILPWKSPWMEEPGRLQSVGLQESDTTET